MYESLKCCRLWFGLFRVSLFKVNLASWSSFFSAQHLLQCKATYRFSSWFVVHLSHYFNIFGFLIVIKFTCKKQTNHSIILNVYCKRILVNKKTDNSVSGKRYGVSQFDRRVIAMESTVQTRYLRLVGSGRRNRSSEPSRWPPSYLFLYFFDILFTS